MYGYPTSNEVDTVRCDIVKKRFTPGDDRPLAYCKGIDLTQLPPCRSSLRRHIKRAHYQALIWRSATENREIPDPDHYGWKRTEHGNLLIDWCAQDILPLELVDIISEDRNEEGSESDLDNSDYEN